MRYILTLIPLFLFISINAHTNKIQPVGFPNRSSGFDVLPGFVHPPKGYGEVSFYWWLGDTLTHDRIIWQLEQLKEMNITGLQINYCHSDKGGSTYGLTYPSQPALFSDKWWELFQWFLKEAQKRDMSVSLSDYTLGAAGQGWFIDEMLNENPNLKGSKLASENYNVSANQELRIELPTNLLSMVVYKNVNGILDATGKIDLTSYVKNNKLSWKAPSGDWKVIAVYFETINNSYDPMNPLSGQKVSEKFYQRFEDHCPGESGKGLNFFFSDELQFGLRGFLWNDKFAKEFMKRKGYDIVPELSSLFLNIDSKSYNPISIFSNVDVEKTLNVGMNEVIKP